MVSIFFMLLKIPLFSIFLFFFRTSTVYTKWKPRIRTTGISLKCPVIFLKVCFLKGLENISRNILHGDREAHGACARMTSTLCDQSTLSVMSGFISEQRIQAVDCNPLFSLLEK